MKKLLGIMGAIVSFVFMALTVTSCSPYDPDDDDDDDMMTRSERLINIPSEDNGENIIDYASTADAE